MEECGINYEDLFENKTQVECLASGIFSDDFHMYMDKTHKEVNSYPQIYSDHSQAQG